MMIVSWIPLALVPLAAAAIVLLVGRKPWFARRKIVVGVLMSLAAALLLAALARPTVVGEGRGVPPHVILVADASASMTAAQDWREVAGWVEAVLPQDVALTVVPFGARPVERPLRRGQVRLNEDGTSAVEARIATDLDAMGSNVEQALRTAAAVVGPDGRRSVVLVYSDGWWTSGDDLAAVEALRRQGMRVGVIAPVKEDIANARIVDVRAPTGANVGQTIEVRVTVQANRAGPAEVTLRARSGAARAAEGTDAAGVDGDKAMVSRVVELQAGVAAEVVLPWRSSEGGLATLTVGVRMAGDAIAGDNIWSLPLQVGADRPVLVVQGPGTGEALRRLRSVFSGGNSGGIEVVPAMHAPQTAGALGRYRAVVLMNVSRLALGTELERALGSYVRDMGGGLVVLGGGEAFGQGGYAGGLIDDLLPLTSRTQHRPPIHLAVVLDRSASMIEAVGGQQKLEIAKDAVGALEQVLIAGDRLSLVAFNHDYEAVLRDVAASGDWGAVRAALAPLVPRGGTNLGPALSEALGLLGDQVAEVAADIAGDADASRAPRRHLIVVSDGESEPFDVAALAAVAAESSITISVVATSGGQVRALVELAARGGGRYYDVAGELITPLVQNRLAQIFMDDLPLDLTVTTPAEVRMVDPSPLWPQDARPTPALAPVPAHMVTQAKERATVHAEAAAAASADLSATADSSPRPLAASWQLGLGRAVAVAVPADVPAAVDWLASADFARGLAGGVQWVSSAAAGHADYDATVRVEGGVVRAEVQQRRLSGEVLAAPQVRLDLYGLDESRGALIVPLEASGPGHWQASAALSGGAYSYVLRVEGGEADGQVVATGALSGGIAAELRSAGVNAAALALLAERGGGAVLRSPAEVANIELPRPEQKDLWPLLVVLAGAALLGQIAFEIGGWRRRSRG